MFKDVLIVLHRDIVYPSFVPYRLRGKEYPYCRIGEIVTLFQNNMKFIKTARRNRETELLMEK